MAVASTLDTGGTSAARRAAGAYAALTYSVRFWFVTAVIGQWAFLYYIAAFYDAATLRGDFAAWSRNTFLLKGYVAGDTAGNLAFATHVMLAALVTFGGALQLIPWLRSRFISVHRWNGRLFLVTAIAAALSGLYMIWVRGSRQNLTAGIATSLDAVLIIVFALQAWRWARAREIPQHRRWALRTFIVANGVWFQRIGMFGWAVANNAPVGMTEHFDGWFDLTWAFGCYLVPLAVLEGYLYCRERAEASARFGMAAVVLLLTFMTGFGAYAAYAFVWRPFLWGLGG